MLTRKKTPSSKFIEGQSFGNFNNSNSNLDKKLSITIFYIFDTNHLIFLSKRWKGGRRKNDLTSNWKNQKKKETRGKIPLLTFYEFSTPLSAPASISLKWLFFLPLSHSIALSHSLISYVLLSIIKKKSKEILESWHHLLFDRYFLNKILQLIIHLFW